MPLTDIEQIRLRAADPERTFAEEFAGDGNTTIFDLSHFPVVAASEQVRVAGTLQTDPTNYALVDATGRITFVTAPVNAARVTVQARSVIWTDTELQDIIDRRGSVRDALLECALILMADGARRTKWGTNLQGLSVDESMLAKNAKDWYETLKADQLDQAFGGAGLEEWSSTQEDYV